MKEIEPWLNRIALATARAYSTWVSFEDVRQSLWLWAHKNTERIDEYLAHPEGERIIRSALNQEARNYAAKERAVSSGYEFEDVAWYTETAIKRLLPDVFDYADWQSFEAVRGGGGSGKPAAWSGDKLATLIDVSRAVDSLPADRKELLREHYSNGVPAAACAAALGIPEDTVRKRLQRAVKAISKALNDPRPTDPMEGVTIEQWRANRSFYDTRSKGRHAVSNAAARKMTETNYGE